MHHAPCLPYSIRSLPLQCSYKTCLTVSGSGRDLCLACATDYILLFSCGARWQFKKRPSEPPSLRRSSDCCLLGCVPGRRWIEAAFAPPGCGHLNGVERRIRASAVRLARAVLLSPPLSRASSLRCRRKRSNTFCLAPQLRRRRKVGQPTFSTISARINEDTFQKRVKIPYLNC